MQKICSKCKMNIQDVLDSGIVGCKECYVEFREELFPIIKDIQKNTQKTRKNLKMRVFSFLFKNFYAIIYTCEL